MLGLREDLVQRIEAHEKALRGMRLSLIGAAVLVVVYLPLVVRSLLDGWRPSAYFHLFIVGVWAGFFAVQYKIWRRRKKVLNGLVRELEGLGGE